MEFFFHRIEEGSISFWGLNRINSRKRLTPQDWMFIIPLPFLSYEIWEDWPSARFLMGFRYALIAFHFLTFTFGKRKWTIKVYFATRPLGKQEVMERESDKWLKKK